MKFIVIASLWVIVCVSLYIACQFFINKQYGDKEKLNKEADEVLNYNKDTSLENMKIKDVLKLLQKSAYQLLWHKFEIKTEHFNVTVPTTLFSFMFFIGLSTATSSSNIFESILAFIICGITVGFFASIDYIGGDENKEMNATLDTSNIKQEEESDTKESNETEVKLTKNNAE